MWKVSALRDYLHQRGLPNAGKSKSELAALVYGSMQLCLKPVKTAIEIEEAKKEYSKMLSGESFQLTDPATIKDDK